MGHPVDLEYTYLVEPFGTTAGRSFPHTGDDFARKKINGKPIQEQPDILAAFSGTVIAAGWHAQAGNRTVIRYWFGRIGVYAHQAKLLVTAGQNVTEGQKIGLLGGTGKVTGPHLHYSQYTSEARALSGIVQYWQGVKWASVDAWATASGLVRPIYRTKDSAASGGSEDAMDAAQYKQFSEAMDASLGRLEWLMKAIGGSNEGSHAIRDHLKIVEAKAAGADGAAQWTKQRLGGSVLSGPSITALVGGISSTPVDASALADAIATELGPDLAKQVAGELGKRISNG